MSDNSKNQNRSASEANEQENSGLSGESRSGNSEHNNASSNQGGTTDMDRDALVAGRKNEATRGSGISTKRSVTGSDYDGQTSNS